MVKIQALGTGKTAVYIVLVVVMATLSGMIYKVFFWGAGQLMQTGGT